MPATELDLEAVRDGCAQDFRRRSVRRVVVDMGVIASDIGGFYDRTAPARTGGCNGPAPPAVSNCNAAKRA